MTLPGFPPASGGEPHPRDSRPAYDAPSSGARPGPGRPPAREPDESRTHSTRSGRRTSSTRGEVREPAEQTETSRAARMMEATRVLTRTTAKRIDDISRKDGADKSGLRTLIWSNALSMGGDAMITVYLAATLFFAAPGDQQRGNVALYLLVTVAPFAVIAPIIGPFLDRIDRGRRAALAGTYAIRAVLCYLLAVHTDSTVLLYICALLLLVFSRAFSVLRAAVVPRVLPEQMALVAANSRVNVFGMCGAGAFGAIAAGVMNVFNFLEPVEEGTTPGEVAPPTLGFTIALILAAVVFLAGAWVVLRLPARVDTDEGEGKIAMSTRGDDGGRERVSPSGVRIVLGTHVVTALRSSAVQKFLGGFLTFFMVFYIQATMKGFAALAVLAALGAVAGIGSFLGTSIGTRFAETSPDQLVLIASGVAVACCILAAVTPGVAISIVVALIAAVLSALGKIALDAIIQREIPQTFRSSAFSRSETVLQLAWVFGGTVGILLPTSAGTLWLGWTVAALLMSLAFGLILYGRYKSQQDGPQRAAVRPKDASHKRFAIGHNRRAKSARKAPSSAERSSRRRDEPGDSYAGERYQRRTSEPAADWGTAPDAAPGPSAARGDESWLNQPAPDVQPTKALPDFRAAGLRPPADPPRRPGDDTR